MLSQSRVSGPALGLSCRTVAVGSMSTVEWPGAKLGGVVVAVEIVVAQRQTRDRIESDRLHLRGVAAGIRAPIQIGFHLATEHVDVLAQPRAQVLVLLEERVGRSRRQRILVALAFGAEGVAIVEEQILLQRDGLRELRCDLEIGRLGIGDLLGGLRVHLGLIRGHVSEISRPPGCGRS